MNTPYAEAFHETLKQGSLRSARETDLPPINQAGSGVTLSTGERRGECHLIADNEHGRYGYRGITALLHQEGWRVNHKHVERIWRQEGLNVPQKQPKQARLWLADGSCIRGGLSIRSMSGRMAS
jgi:hypothetical protein